MSTIRAQASHSFLGYTQALPALVMLLRPHIEALTGGPEPFVQRRRTAVDERQCQPLLLSSSNVLRSEIDAAVALIEVPMRCGSHACCGSEH
jgi:hypothetical protein